MTSLKGKTPNLMIYDESISNTAWLTVEGRTKILRENQALLARLKQRGAECSRPANKTRIYLDRDEMRELRRLAGLPAAHEKAKRRHWLYIAHLISLSELRLEREAIELVTLKIAGDTIEKKAYDILHGKDARIKNLLSHFSTSRRRRTC